MTERQTRRSEDSMVPSILSSYWREPELLCEQAPVPPPAQSVPVDNDSQTEASALFASEQDMCTITSIQKRATIRQSEIPHETTIGWKAVTMLVGFYLLDMALTTVFNEHKLTMRSISGLLIAVLHLIMMKYLDGKPTDARKYLAQPYVSSLSLLLVASFKASLCASLAVAFTQHMWKVLRHRSLRLASIEPLHGVRYNPLLLTKWRLFVATPLLYLMATNMLLLAITILFPPSSLVIILHPFEES